MEDDWSCGKFLFSAAAIGHDVLAFEQWLHLGNAGGRQVDHGGSIVGETNSDGALFIFETAEVHKVYTVCDNLF